MFGDRNVLKAYSVSDGDFGMLVFAKNPSKAKAFAIAAWWHDESEYIDFRAKRYPKADGLSSEPGVLWEDEKLASIGWKNICQECEKTYLIGTEHVCYE